MSEPSDKWDPIESIGPTGATVAANVRRLRKDRNWPFTELSARLKSLRREIPPLGLRKIESGGRRVDTDDLMALALAFDVSPITLLLPDVGASTMVAATGVEGEVRAERLWNWLNASYPLRTDVLAIAYLLSDALPSWEREQNERQAGSVISALKHSRGAGSTNGDD
jgi:transcriptional regulator with XRE-family HTH domain